MDKYEYEANHRLYITNWHENFGSGYNFTITVAYPKMPRKTYEIFYRTSQPCYGEMRKYKSTHEDCNMPENKPCDLDDPFPFNGNPVALTVGFTSGHKEFLETVFLKSNMKEIFKHAEIFNIKGGKCVLFLPDCEFDPTTAVNFFKNILCSDYQAFNFFKNNGITDPNLLSFLEMFVNNPYKDSSGAWRVQGINTYSSTNTPSYKNFVDANPNILSSDLFSNRGDYNRKELDKVWTDPLVYAGTHKKEDLFRFINAESIAMNVKTAGEFTKMVEKIVPLYDSRITELTPKVVTKSRASSMILTDAELQLSSNSF